VKQVRKVKSPAFNEKYLISITLWLEVKGWPLAIV
jgi:hypothetical protein